MARKITNRGVVRLHMNRSSSRLLAEGPHIYILHASIQAFCQNLKYSALGEILASAYHAEFSGIHVALHLYFGFVAGRSFAQATVRWSLSR